MSGSVDISKIKVGDTVTVQGVVTELSDHHGDFRLNLGTNGSSYAMFARADAIVSHTSAPLNVGDRVRASDCAATFSIVCIDDGWAWLRDGESSRIQLPLSDLERVS